MHYEPFVAHTRYPKVIPTFASPERKAEAGCDFMVGHFGGRCTASPVTQSALSNPLTLTHLGKDYGSLKETPSNKSSGMVSWENVRPSDQLKLQADGGDLPTRQMYLN